MKTMILPRVFLHRENGHEIRLTDPNDTFTIVDVQEAEEGWWFGRYDREQKLYRTEEVGY